MYASRRGTTYSHSNQPDHLEFARGVDLDEAEGSDVRGVHQACGRPRGQHSLLQLHHRHS